MVYILQDESGTGNIYSTMKCNFSIQCVFGNVLCKLYCCYVSSISKINLKKNNKIEPNVARKISIERSDTNNN